MEIRRRKPAGRNTMPVSNFKKYRTAVLLGLLALGLFLYTILSGLH